MSAPERQGLAATVTTIGAKPSLLDQAIAATKQTDPVQAQDLLRTLTEEALNGTVIYSKNLTETFNQAIIALDEKISRQLTAIIQHPKFLQLEGSWRGLHYLVRNTDAGTQQEIRVLTVSKRDLYKDMKKADEFDQSQLFKKIYENEFGTPGGKPYGALIGDYQFSNHPEDIELLEKVSNVAAAAFVPLISAASPQMFGFSDFTELSKPRDIEKIFTATEYSAWRSFRETDDSRFVTLVMPRVLARLPYGSKTCAVEEFNFEEVRSNDAGTPLPLDADKYCWTNAAYSLGARLTNAFAESSFCVAIRGAEGGGKVENLPTYLFASDDGDQDTQCPTEVGITDRREAELSKAGFLPLCHYKNTNYAVFFGAQTVNKPKTYDRPEATGNAAISARLPYIMATSRIAHYLKVMARDKIGSFKEAADCEKWLNRWILGYVNASPGAGAESRAKFPLREARVEVKEVPGAPGTYNAVAYLRPWLQMEELTASLRLVARIPKIG